MQIGTAPTVAQATPSPRRIATATCALALLAACGGGIPKIDGPIDGAAAMRHVEALVEIGPRPFGSDALAKAADYIEAQVDAIDGIELRRHEVVHEKEKKTIRNLYAVIEGEDPDNGPILMFGAHYDTKLAEGHADPAHNFPFVGAIDGGGAPAVLIELLRAIKARTPKPKCNVWFYWIDAEESIDWTWKDERALLGSEAFCDMLSKEKILPRVKAFVLLDLIGSKNLKIDRDGNSATKLVDLFGDVAKELGVTDRVYEFPTELELAYARQQGIEWGNKDDHLNFAERGVPSVLLIDFARRIPPHLQNLQPGQEPLVDDRYEQWWHTRDDDLDAMDPAALAFTGNLVMAAFDELEAFVTRTRGK